MLARWRDVSDEMGAFTTDQRVLRFEIRANAFCHQMVRSIVGTMVDIGVGKLPRRRRARHHARQGPSAGETVAPPHGLCLWDVGYRLRGLR